MLTIGAAFVDRTNTLNTGLAIRVYVVACAAIAARKQIATAQFGVAYLTAFGAVIRGRQEVGHRLIAQTLLGLQVTVRIVGYIVTIAVYEIII